ncbi:hypothetical protein [Treponema brennaborense]|uniref:Zinc-finger domain-containing protein n=1 Tax=Treponema brennaborense (strain DSM 12168 / CIP 105900 / DD5/3) TaxID=906968 RepID=F4LPF6_TREBD|nr:hypothetical protein [Treponema brennaborense]AEE15967.1 hypothetical protein Trebr_0524 [Treponema brennaborense DSM 12168]
MNRTCEQIMDDFLALDKNERMPLHVTVHLLRCKKCRTAVRLCSCAEKSAARPLKTAESAAGAAVVALMKKIDPSYKGEEPVAPISLKRWVVSGIAMIVAMLMFRLTPAAMSSETLVVSFYLLFALVVTAYCAIFVGSNLDFFVKKIETFKPRAAA